MSGQITWIPSLQEQIDKSNAPKTTWVTEELVDVIEGIYNKMVERQEYESSWVKPNGEHETTDVGYAKEGAYLFLEELKENLLCEQIAMFDKPKHKKTEDEKLKRNWENAFQKWSNDSFINDGTTSYGACGFGSMCDWCESNDYGRPCVRALNAMCRDKHIQIDYTNRDFEKIWDM